MRHRRTEDWLSMAQRHVAEGEAHVARQETLIAGLDRDGHTELAAEARALLTTLETSLRLMRADLSRIENEPRRSGPSDFWFHLRPNTGNSRYYVSKRT